MPPEDGTVGEHQGQGILCGGITDREIHQSNKVQELPILEVFPISQ